MPSAIWGLVIEHLETWAKPSFPHEQELENVALAHPEFRSILSECDALRKSFIHRWTSWNPALDLTTGRLVIRPELLRAFGDQYGVLKACIPAILRRPAQMNVLLTNQSTRVYDGPSIQAYDPNGQCQQSMWNVVEAMDHTRWCTNRFASVDAIAGHYQVVRANCDYGPPFPKVHVYPKRGRRDSVEPYVTIVPGGYFELTIEHTKSRQDVLRGPSSGRVDMGLATMFFDLHKNQLGQDGLSYGYRSEDGQFYQNGQAQAYGPAFGPGDTVGCGVYSLLEIVPDVMYQSHDLGKTNHTHMRILKNVVFFTLNGEKLPDIEISIVRSTCTPVFPVVGLDSLHVIQMNFGASAFVYDGYAHIEQQTMPRSFVERFRSHWNTGALSDYDRARGSSEYCDEVLIYREEVASFGEYKSG